MEKARLELLQRMPIFGGLDESTLETLLSLSVIVSVGRGEYFFRETDMGESLFVLESGKVAIMKSWKGKEHALRDLSHGDCFGEMAVMDLFPRSASVLALENCTAIEISVASLYQLYEKDIEQFTVIQMNLGREVSRRLREADERIFRAEVEGNGSVNNVFRYT
jgi:CRP/FNR family transcriptional regulator, cyclic AMP receptor protein